jgi:conjugative transfer region protein TrbK
LRTGPDTVLKLIAFAMGRLVLLMAAIELKTALTLEESASVERRTDDPLRRELARCRTLTPEQFETDTTCRAAWAENRRRFFGQPSDGPEG